MTVPTQIEAAFADLRIRGYEARGEFLCCQTCARAQLALEGHEDNIVFYHCEDAEMLASTSSCYLAWDGDGNEIVEILRRHGLHPVWDGSEGSRIEITWTRRH